MRFVSDTGGWQDKSFNESAYDGLIEEKSYLGSRVDTAESDTEDDFVSNVDKMVAADCTLVIGVGFHLEPRPFISLPHQHPDRNYAMTFTDGTDRGGP